MTDQLTYEPPQQAMTALPSRLDIAVLALRLLGIYVLLQVATMTVLAVPAVVGPLALPNWRDALILLALIGGGACVGVSLIVFGESIGRRLLPSTGGAAGEPSLQLASLQSVAYSVVGVYLIATTLPSLGSNMIHAFQNGYSLRTFEMLTAGAQLIIGIFLFLQGKGLAGLWYKLRTAGTQPPPDQFH